MKLKRLAISRLPGINESFEIQAAGTGFNVIFGPNGVGKSSICRAVEGLYWNDRGSSQRTSIISEFEIDKETWRVERDGSRVRWQRDGEDSVPPNLPASHNHRCFFLRLRDLINPSPGSTQDIASEIRRQMSGGFDLNQIAADQFSGVGPRHGRGERVKFNKASDDVGAAEGKQSGLQRRADELEALKAELDAAEAAARRLTAVDRALELAGRCQEHTDLAEEIAVLPQGLAKLTGKEAEDIEGLQTRIDDLNGRARTLEGNRDDARDEKSDSGLSSPLSHVELTIWQDKADELIRLELALQTARADYNATQKELAAALAALGGGKIDEANLDLADHSQLFQFLRTVEAHKGKVHAIEERLRLLASIEQTDGGQIELERFRSAVNALRSWLRAPEPKTLQDKIRSRQYWILIALTMAIAGAGLATFVDPMFALLAATGVGVAATVIMLRDPGATSGARAAARDVFGKLGIEEPDTWDLSAVELRLHGLEDEIATIDSQIQRARDRDVERKTLKNDLDGQSKEESDLSTQRQELTDSLKLEKILPDAELVDFARALDQLRSARIKDDGAAGKVDCLQERHGQYLSDLADDLQRHGEPQPNDATEAKAYLNNLATRNARFIKAISDEEQADKQLNLDSDDRSKDLNSIVGIYSEVGLSDGDLAGLTTMLNSLPHYNELRDRALVLGGQIKLDQDWLVNSGEADLAECDRVTLERQRDDISKFAEQEKRLREEIAEINAQVNEAKRGNNVLDLIATREEARTRLADRRDEALFAKAGKFLIDAVEDEHEQTQTPRVFERARNHFSAFTHHSYELRLGREAKDPQLYAVELRSGEGRSLDELSDGTRAQLLLAARIAFAEEVEQGKTLPLFLDEALDQSDPERFEAIVRGLGRIGVDQDRQIFYLTNDPLDVDRIRHALDKENYQIASTIDLGLIRTQTASVSGPGALHIEPREMVPTPDGLTAEQYGVAVGVPQLAPAHGYEQQHFFYVLSDDLKLLQNFLVNGIERVGQWKTVSGTTLADSLCLGSISPEEIGFRADLLEVFCELWRQGRGRPVDREALELSGALTANYLDDVVTIAAELGGDPEIFLSALSAREDPRLRGFQRRRIESLESYFRDNGYLDDQQVLSDGELRLLALTSPAANALPEGIAIDYLNRWWTWAERSLNA